MIVNVDHMTVWDQLFYQVQWLVPLQLLSTQSLGIVYRLLFSLIELTYAVNVANSGTFFGPPLSCSSDATAILHV